MSKEIAGYVKLQIPAGKANPSPPIGPALGQRGINIMDFCKQFNDKTKGMEPGMPIPVVITAFKDRSFSFIMKLPPVSYFLKKEAKLESGSKEPGKTVCGQIKMTQIYKIAEAKMADLNANDVDAAASMIAGSARSMGLEIVDDKKAA